MNGQKDIDRSPRHALCSHHRPVHSKRFERSDNGVAKNGAADASSHTSLASGNGQVFPFAKFHWFAQREERVQGATASVHLIREETTGGDHDNAPGFVGAQFELFLLVGFALDLDHDGVRARREV